MRQTGKDQFVVGYVTDPNQPDVVLSHAVRQARMIGKGLILLHISDPRYHALSPDEAEPLLQALCARSGLPGATYCALKGKTADVVGALPTALGAVAVVAEAHKGERRRSPRNGKELLRNFARCRTAYLVAQQACDEKQPTDVALSVDFRRESKEKFVWSSYFARFAHSRVHALHYDYRDQGLFTKWQANMGQLSRLFQGFKQEVDAYPMANHSLFLDTNGVRTTAEQGWGLYITVTTNERDALEYLIGTQEQRTVVNPWHIPVLFLNPRQDLYVLCD